MLRSLAPLRALGKARMVHTTAVRSDQTSREITSDFLARLMKQSPSNSASSSSGAATSPHDAARGMINSVGMAENPDSGRHSFSTKQIIPPHVFEEKHLYPEDKPFISAPLLGPNKKVARRIDPFYIRSQDPVDHAMNPLVCNEFIEATGRIKSRASTGLTWRSQRRVGKMVRRARAMGVISKWSNRPRPGGLGYRDATSYRRRFD